MYRRGHLVLIVVRTNRIGIHADIITKGTGSQSCELCENKVTLMYSM